MGIFIALASHVQGPSTGRKKLPLRKATRTDEVQRNVGDRIRSLRRQYGWSQEQFAQACGLHRTYMGHIERGEKNLSLSTMLRISDALSIRLAELFLQGKSRSLPSRKPPEAARLRHAHFGFAEIKYIFAELRIERNALKQAVRDLARLIQRQRGWRRQ